MVHSFYYKQDQLDKQDSAYHNRTALFVNMLSKGNASLRLDRVGVNDAGRYLCIVSTQQGTDKAELRLAYGGNHRGFLLLDGLCLVNVCAAL